MAYRNAVELESAINARLFYIVNQPVSGEDIETRLKAIADVALSSIMWEFVGSNMIPLNLVKGTSHEWTKDMLKFAEINITPKENPQLRINVRKMTEKIYQGHQGRIAISTFMNSISGHRAKGTLRDEELSDELMRRGLEKVLIPTPSVPTSNTASIADKVQKTVAAMEARRTQELQEQRRRDKEEEEIKDNSFARKVELE